MAAASDNGNTKKFLALGVAAAAGSFLLGKLWGGRGKKEKQQSKQKRAAPADPVLRDPSSYSNHWELENGGARVQRYHLELAVDFDASVLKGHVDLEVVALGGGASKVVLDTNHLTIHSVVNGDTGKKIDYDLAKEDPVFGRALSITLPEGGAHRDDGGVSRISIFYQTSPESPATQWLPPSQTAGKKHPYMFTQCQAIHARAFLPCQDSPGNKAPYTAAITVAAPHRALMSAVPDGCEENKEEGTSTFRFRQNVPVPSYLIALTAGDVEKRDIGPRSAVYSEASVVDKAAHEFADTEKYIAAAEAICGPYVWGRYDILCLPPSFAWGGMEHPCLTNVTPTLLAGDRSLASVCAHEIAHSWFGNLVSCSTWEHFWLNEGFTVFLERKILRAVEGPKFQNMHAIIGSKALVDAVKHYGDGHDFTALVPDLTGVDPDDSFSSIPYEKGFNLLWYLETLVGREAMNGYLRAHCERFKFRCTDTDTWREFFLAHFSADKHPEAAKKLAKVDWKTWLRSPGMPPVANEFDTSLVDVARNHAVAVVEGKVDKVSSSDLDGWSSLQVVVFLNRILALQEGVKDQAAFLKLLDDLDEAHNFTSSQNAEIRFRWYNIGIVAGREAAFKAAVQFLGEQGRMKYVRPLYRALYAQPKSKDLAVETFKKLRSTYQIVCSKMAAKDLELD